MNEIEYMAERLHVLIDGTIKGVVMSEGDPGSYGLRIRKSDGQLITAWIDCDPEGNGPGWLALDGL